MVGVGVGAGWWVGAGTGAVGLLVGTGWVGTEVADPDPGCARLLTVIFAEARTAPIRTVTWVWPAPCPVTFPAGLTVATAAFRVVQTALRNSAAVALAPLGSRQASPRLRVCPGASRMVLGRMLSELTPVDCGLGAEEDGLAALPAPAAA